MENDHLLHLTRALADLSDSQPDGASSAAEKAPTLEEWCDGLESRLLAAGGARAREAVRDDDAAATASLAQDAADALVASILAAVPASLDLDLDLRAPRGRAREEDAAPAGGDPRRLAGALRAAGLFLRWAAAASSPPGRAAAPVAALRSAGMVRLYATLLDDADGGVDDAAAREGDLPAAPLAPPDVARCASICLFRATYGSDAAATAAREAFVASPDGCARLARALRRGGQPVARLFSVVRNVHHLASACPAAIPKMEDALLRSSPTVAGGGEGDGDGAPRPCLSEVLIATLAWAFRSDPPFPGDAATDRRADLVSEILRALYALDHSGSGPSGRTSRRPSEDAMTQIGTLLCDILRASSADERVYRAKLDAVTLLLDAPKQYAGFLAQNGGIPPLVDLLSYQTSLVLVERTASSKEDAAEVLPILLALRRLAASHHAALDRIKDGVFPPAAEDAFEDRAAAELDKGKTQGTVRAKNMAPLDAPPGTLRRRLVDLMTHLDPGVKRGACELLWELSDRDSTRFVLRTGFGNAVHFLGIRGCVDMPAGV